MSYEIFFQEYHGMWHNTFPKEGAKVEEVWDSYKEREAIEAVFHPTDEQFVELLKYRILSASQGQVIPAEYSAMVLYQPDRLEPEMNIWVVRIDDLEKFKRLFADWMNDDLIHLEEHRGADDGTYDYYPDAWDVAYQIAKALGLKGSYNHARQILMETTAYGPDRPDSIGEELIPTWEA
jgi:hypothetical protein